MIDIAQGAIEDRLGFFNEQMGGDGSSLRTIFRWDAVDVVDDEVVDGGGDGEFERKIARVEAIVWEAAQRLIVRSKRNRIGVAKTDRSDFKGGDGARV